MELAEINNTELNELILAEERGVVLDFWGTWCQPCRTLRPHLERLADDYADNWRLVAVKVENNEDIVERFDVTQTPTLVFLKQGDEIHRISGAATPAMIAEAMDQN